MSSDSVISSMQRLADWFAPFEGSITAFSGGVDSSLVLYLSRYFLGENGVGCISVSPSLKRRDFSLAREFCDTFDISLNVIETQELDDPKYRANNFNRCYFCKSHLYKQMATLKERYPNFVILNGTNVDDLSDHRPGLQAARESEIRSPLLDCNLAKTDVRLLAKHFKLPNHNKPASPCLSSRIPFKEPVSLVKLGQVEAAEAILDSHGFHDSRVRHYGDEARIEVPLDQIGDLKNRFSKLSPGIVELGFDKCSIDEEGLVSGKLSRGAKNAEI